MMTPEDAKAEACHGGGEAASDFRLQYTCRSVEAELEERLDEELKNDLEDELDQEVHCVASMTGIGPGRATTERWITPFAIR